MLCTDPDDQRKNPWSKFFFSFVDDYGLSHGNAQKFCQEHNGRLVIIANEIKYNQTIKFARYFLQSKAKAALADKLMRAHFWTDMIYKAQYEQVKE